MQAVTIDRVRRDDPNRDPLSAADDGPKELLPLGRRDLLGVVQQSERAHAVVAEAAVVEEDARDDQWPGE